MRKKEDTSCIDKAEEDREPSDKKQNQREKTAKPAMAATTSSSSSSSPPISSSAAPAAHHPPAQQRHGAQSKQTLGHKVTSVVMDIIVPIGKKNRNHKGLLPKKTSFVFTEDHALKKVVRRMLKDCPTMCSQVPLPSCTVSVFFHALTRIFINCTEGQGELSRQDPGAHAGGQGGRGGGISRDNDGLQ